MPSNESAWNTNESLLRKVKNPHDDKSWEEFAYYYQPFIYNLVRSMNIPHHDAEEIVQQVLLKAWDKLPSFEYDRTIGRFRGWLCQVTSNLVRDFLRKHSSKIENKLERVDVGISDSMLQTVNIPEIEKIAEKEWRSYISKLAWENVSKRFRPHVLQSFLLVTQSMPIGKIVDKLGINESTVYVYKHRVQKELRSEIVRLNYYLG